MSLQAMWRRLQLQLPIAVVEEKQTHLFVVFKNNLVLQYCQNDTVWDGVNYIGIFVAVNKDTGRVRRMQHGAPTCIRCFPGWTNLRDDALNPP